MDLNLGGLQALVTGSSSGIGAGGKTAAGNPPWFDVGWQDWLGTYEQNVGAAVRLAHTGITVNSVMPGTILTPAVEGWLSHVSQQQGWGTDWAEIERRFTSEFIPLCTSRLGRPEDIGCMVAPIASPLSGYMTGSKYRADRGQVRSIG